MHETRYVAKKLDHYLSLHASANHELVPVKQGSLSLISTPFLSHKSPESHTRLTNLSCESALSCLFYDQSMLQLQRNLKP